MTGSLWHDGGYRQDGLGTMAVYGTQESGESPWLGGGDVESQVGADWKRTRWRGSKAVQELQARMSKEVEVGVPKGCAPLGTYRVEETNGLIDESHEDCWVARSCNADGHNGALKAMMCIYCHITPMGSYMVRSRKV